MHLLQAFRLAVLLGAGAAVTPAIVADAQASAPPRTRVVTQGSRTLAQRGTVRVAVAARHAGRYELRLTLRARPHGTAILAGRRTATLPGRGQHILALRVNAAGRRLIGRCVPLEATVTLGRRGHRLARGRRLLRTSGRSCAAATRPPGLGAGGSAPGGPGSPGGGGSPGGTSAGASGGSGGGTGLGSAGGSDSPVAPGFDTSTADRCDPLDPSVCLQPFPNDHFTASDPGAATGRKLSFQTASMPKNKAGKPIDPSDINVSDGFSPGSALVTRVPGLDSKAAAAASDLPPIDDPDASLLPDSPVVVLDAATGKPHPVWAEVDMNPADPGQRNLVIRPSVNFEEGHRYVVALRRLRTADGTAIPAGRAFRVYRDAIRTTDPAAEQRRPELERVLATTTAAGVDRAGLFLAWDFTVATAHSATARMLSIRDRAFGGLGDANLADRVVQGAAPSFTLNPDIPDDTPEAPGSPENFSDLDGVRDFTPEQDAKIARVVRGTYQVPCYLTTASCANGGTFAYAPGDPFTPVQIPGNTATAQFTCIIPRRALDAGSTEELRPNLYGHGLFGGQGEVMQGQQKSLAQEHGFLPCATNWSGMATEDVPTALAVLQDLSQFPQLIDHVQQGFLQKLYLGRLMLHPQGFSANAAFQRAGAQSVIDTTRLFYDGNSQGGIYGGTLTAIAPDFDRAVLGVPGMNYSTLLPRSVDFDTYAKGEVDGVDAPAGGLYDNYPDELQRTLILGLLQIMWDRGDPNGYAEHMTDDPLPGTPPHLVLMHSAFGDHQVADVTAEVMARTIGARVHRPVLEPGRPRFAGRPTGAAAPPPYEGLGSLGAPGYAATGSGLVFWDIGPERTEGGEAKGEPPPPADDVPPRTGQDPHEAPRNTVNGRIQKSHFLQAQGTIDDVCLGPCFAFDYAGGAPQP